MKERFFKLAEKLSQKSSHPDYKHGAVVVHGNRILGIGFNECRIHSKSRHPFKMRHAEFSAVLNTAREDLSGCDIYVFRRGKDGIIRNSKPCQSCESMLRLLNIRRVYFSHETGFKMEKY